MNESNLIPVRIAGKPEGKQFSSFGIPITNAPNFAVTLRTVAKDSSVTRCEIEDSPALTHLATGMRVPMALSSVQEAVIVAVILEHLPIRWHGTVDQIVQDAKRLALPLQRWLTKME